MFCCQTTFEVDALKVGDLLPAVAVERALARKLMTKELIQRDTGTLALLDYPPPPHPHVTYRYTWYLVLLWQMLCLLLIKLKAQGYGGRMWLLKSLQLPQFVGGRLTLERYPR